MVKDFLPISKKDMKKRGWEPVSYTHLDVYKRQIVYMDPPYAKDYERGALEALAAGSIIDGYTTIIIEEKLDTDLSYVQDLGYTITKTKTYKTNKHVFLKKEGK